MRKVFLAWKPSCTRSHNQATHLGAREIYIFPFPQAKKGPLILIARYLVSFFKTLAVLYRERPDVVFCLNQPPFLIIAVYLYCRFIGARYLLDSHSAAFNDPKWAWFRRGYAFIARHAFLNINTNEDHKTIVENWGGRSVIMSDIPIDHEAAYRKVEMSGMHVAVVASFMFDEPLEELWEAATMVPDVTFHVTGDVRKAPQELKNDRPENVLMTGFLSVEAYFSLLVSADAVMVLTTRDLTMQMGAYEALSLERPIITSDWRILRESFGDGAVYVDNTPEGIAQGVRKLFSNYSTIASAVAEQKRCRRSYYEGAKTEILEQLRG